MKLFVLLLGAIAINVNNLKCAAEDFDSCTGKMYSLYSHSLDSTGRSPSIKIFTTDRLTKAIDKKFSQLLKAVLDCITNKIKVIETKIRISRNNAMDHSKKMVKPEDVHIKFVEFYEKFENKKTNWEELGSRLKDMLIETKRVLDSLNEGEYAEQIRELIPNHSIDKIDADIDKLAAELEKYDEHETEAHKTTKEKEILNTARNLLTPLNEIADKQLKAEELEPSGNGLTGFEQAVSHKLILYRNELKEIRDEIFK